VDTLEVLGIAAALTSLGAFVLNQYGKLSEDSVWYDGLFLISSAGLFFYAYKTDALPFMIINGAWALVSFVEVLKDLMKASSKTKAHTPPPVAPQ
jgi:hypothetical protein